MPEPGLTDLGLYVYGVVAAADAGAVPRGGPGIDERYAVGDVRESGLVAIVSAVEPGELERGVRDAEAGELAWLERAARTHEQVLARALSADALLPFRFGVVVASEDDARSLLATQAESFEEALAELRGAREWGVKALLDLDRLGDAIAADDPPLAELRQGAEAGTGSAFFARKRFEQQLAERVRAAAAELAEAAHERLSACARHAVANAPQSRQLSGHEGEMILNAAYLVERAREDELRAAVDELESGLEPEALHFELTGPWPAFNFVDAAAESVR